MSTSNTVWIVIAAVVAILVIAALVFAASRASRNRRQRQAEQIREQARLETAKLERREALADETAAKARAAQAEAEVKAAEAARLQERAAKHQSETAASREQLDEQLNRADSIDPGVKKDKKDAREDRDRSVPGRHEVPDESYEPTTDVEAGGHDHRAPST
jgi:flagellar biosynthesis/type III secretory pathway M-ring protein FliF/YscJ